MITEFNNLPTEVKEEIKTVLSAYDKCYVWLKDGCYSVDTFTCLSSSIDNAQYKGTYKKEDIFTEEEMIINYVKEFKDFPFPQYKGVKDWGSLRGDWKDVKLDENGDIIFIF